MFRKSGCLESTLRFRNTFVHNFKNRLKAWLLLLLHLWKVLYSQIDGGKISSLLYADLFRLTQFVSAKVPLTRLTKMWFWHLAKQVSRSGKLCNFNAFSLTFSPFLLTAWDSRNYFFCTNIKYWKDNFGCDKTMWGLVEVTYILQHSSKILKLVKCLTLNCSEAVWKLKICFFKNLWYNLTTFHYACFSFTSPH